MPEQQAYQPSEGDYVTIRFKPVTRTSADGSYTKATHEQLTGTITKVTGPLVWFGDHMYVDLAGDKFGSIEFIGNLQTLHSVG